MVRKLIAKETLERYGEIGQLKVVRSLIEDKELFSRLYPILNEEVFTVATLKTCVKLLKNFYEENHYFATYDDLKYLIQKNVQTSEEMATYAETFKKLQSEKFSDGQGTMVEIASDLFKGLELKRILTNASASLRDRGYNDDIVTRIVEQTHNLNVNWTDDDLNTLELIQMALERDEVELLPTGLSEVDNHLQGGVERGTCGLLIAGTGVGKSTLGIIMCTNSALIYDKKVLYIFFEGTKDETSRKIMSRLTGKYTRDIAKKKDVEFVRSKIMDNKKTVDVLRNNLRIKKMPNGLTTVEDIRSYIKHLEIAKGWKPDIVFLDYLSCLSTSSDKRLAVTNEWQVMERAMRKIERMAAEENLFFWVAQQTNRNGMVADTKENRMANVQGSFRITQPPSIILYLDREEGDNRASIYLDKCRGASLCEWKRIMLNNGNCQIDMTDTDAGENYVEKVLVDQKQETKSPFIIEGNGNTQN